MVLENVNCCNLSSTYALYFNMVTNKIQLNLVNTFICATFTLLILTAILSAQHVRKDFKKHPNWKILDRGDDCGHSLADRIIGGTEASLGQYPWLVRLGYTYDLDPDHPTVDTYECGGTIISDRYILSAAHCSTEALGITLLSIRLGEHDTSKKEDCMNGDCAPPTQDIAVEEYKCHPHYSIKHLQNDICLIRLAQPIKYNDYVRPICLPVYDTFRKLNMAGSTMEVAGWGITDTVTRKTSNVLMTLRVPVLQQQTCAKAYIPQAEITHKQICAGGVVGRDSCGGDSGGPLMKPFSMKAPPRYFIVGVVSFGPKKCGGTTVPGVYTKVSEYMSWILDTVR